MYFSSPRRSLYAHALLVIFFFSVCPQYPAQAQDTQQTTAKAESVYQLIAQQYIPSISSLEEQEKKKAEEVAQHNAEVLKNRQNAIVPLKLKAVTLASLGTVEKLKIAYQLFGTLPAAGMNEGKPLTPNVYHDLETFCGYVPTLEHHLFSILDNTQTTFGKIELQKIMFQPTNDIPTLTNRQKIIKTLLENEKLLEQLDASLVAIKNTESEFLNFWKKVDDSTSMLFDQVYFQSHWYGNLSRHNQNQTLLELSELWSTTETPLIEPLLCIISLFGLYYKQRANDDSFITFFKKVVTTYYQILSREWENDKAGVISLFFVFSLYAAYFAFMEGLVINQAINHNDITNLIQEKMISVATFSTAMSDLGKIAITNPTLRDAMKDAKILLTQNNNQSKELQCLRAILTANTFKNHASYFSFKGKALASFKFMEMIKNDFIKNLQIVGQIDAYVSLAKFYKSMATHQNAHFCFAEYETAAQPHIAITKYWHPFLNPDKVVTNSIEIGGPQNANNIILTGPNAAGKSTTLKALTTALYMGQTTGIVPAERLTFTPFKLINTYLNIADTEGKESLFQAEMHRAQALINSLKTLRPDEFSFVIMDEIFTGTNPEEGQSGAYGIAKYLSTFNNSCCIVATHYKKLTELAEDTHGAYKNYKVYVIKNANGSFTYPYKIEPGITDQAIALDLLQQEGFNFSILQDAQQAFSDIQAAKKEVVA